MDYGHEWTDKELRKFEKRISAEYKKAANEVRKKLEDYMRRFEIKFKIKQEAVKRGEMTVEEYNKWRYGQIMIGKRWAEMQQNLAEDFHNTNKITASMTKGFTYDAYAMNFNYGTFEAEMGSGVNTAFTLYDRSTVERLVRDDPDMLPPPGKRVSERIAEGKDVLWNKQQIQSVMTQSILQGESIPTIAKRLAETVGDSNMKAAIRNARTMTTGAENAGRIDSYIRAENMGIEMKQMWIATLDNRTRHEHRQLDGQKVKVNTPFKIDGYTIRFPGDPTAAPEMVYNCRCTLIGIVAGSELDKAESAGEYERRNKLNGKSYEEWKNEHAKTLAEPEKEIPKTAEKPAEKSTQQAVEVVPKQQTVVNPEYTETPIKPKGTVETVKEYDAKIDALNKSIENSEAEYQDLLVRQMTSFGTPEYDEINKRIEEYSATFAQKYDELNALREEKTKYLSQRGEAEIRQIIGTIDGEHSISDDLWATNRLTAGDSRSYNNCGYCALAYDARRRGIDCKAPYIYGANDTLVGSWWDGFEYQNTGMYEPQDAADAIISIAEQWGAGARGVVSIDHETGIGHTFEFEVDKDGKCHFIDAQTGVIDARDAFETAKRGSVRFGRTDDKELTKNALMYLEKGGWGDDKYS